MSEWWYLSNSFYCLNSSDCLFHFPVFFFLSFADSLICLSVFFFFSFADNKDSLITRTVWSACHIELFCPGAAEDPPVGVLLHSLHSELWRLSVSVPERVDAKTISVRPLENDPSALEVKFGLPCGKNLNYGNGRPERYSIGVQRHDGPCKEICRDISTFFRPLYLCLACLWPHTGVVQVQNLRSPLSLRCFELCRGAFE